MSIKKILALIVSLSLLSLFIGCANYGSLQTADVMEKDDGSFGFGVTYTNYTLKVDTMTESFGFPALNLWYRRGLTERFELHFNVWLPLGYSIGGKVQAVGSPQDNGFGLSFGLDAGVITMTAGDAKATVLDIYVPIYTGVDFNESVSMYLTPKYIARILFGDGSGVQNIIVGTLGFKFGKKVSFLLEGTGGYDLTVEGAVINAGFGFSF